MSVFAHQHVKSSELWMKTYLYPLDILYIKCNQINKDATYASFLDFTWLLYCAFENTLSLKNKYLYRIKMYI